VHKGAIVPDRTFVHAVKLNLRHNWHIGLLCPSDLQFKEQLTSAQRFYRSVKYLNNQILWCTKVLSLQIEPLCTM